MLIKCLAKATSIIILVFLSFIGSIYFEYERQEDMFQQEQVDAARVMNKQNEEIRLIKASIESFYMASDFVSNDELMLFTKVIQNNSSILFEISAQPVDDMMNIAINNGLSESLYINFIPTMIAGSYIACSNSSVESSACEQVSDVEWHQDSEVGFLMLKDKEFKFGYQDLLNENFILTHLLIMLFLIFIFSIQIKLNKKKCELDIVKQNVIAKDNILNILSHEVKTPLNAVKFNANKLKPSAEKTTILLSSHLLEGTIDNILNSNKKYRPIKESVNTKYLENDINAIYVDLFRKKRIDFAATIDDANIIADKILLRRLVFNLIDNAFKYTNEGCVTISGHVVGDLFHLRIEDTGIGIPSKYLKDIFKPYHQVNSSKPGFGLGLSIVEEISKSLDIKVDVTSKENKGTTFTVQVPIALSDCNSESEKFMCSLAIDDDIFNREIYSEIAKENDLNMVVAKNSEEALLLFDKYQPTLVLTDINLGEKNMNGFDVAKAIRNKSKDTSIKIYAVTADITKYKHLSDAIIDGLIEKPFSAEQIVNLYKKYCV